MNAYEPQTATEATRHPDKWREIDQASFLSKPNECLGKRDGELCEVKTVNGVTYRVYCRSNYCSHVFEKIG